MLGISDIGTYICSDKISNFDRKTDFDINDEFIKEKIGFQSLSKSSDDEKTFYLMFKGI